MKTPQTECLYLFSSNTRRLYRQDVINALAVPRGFIMHFRYEKKYVASKLWESISYEPDVTRNMLKGTSVVVTYVHQEAIGGKQEEMRVLGLFPLRLGKVIDIDTDGDTIHVYFTLDEYFAYAEPESESTKIYVQALDEVLGESKPPAVYVATGGSYPIEAPPEATSAPFQSVVRAISGHGLRVDRTLFVRILGLRQVTGKLDLDELPLIDLNNEELVYRSVYKIAAGLHLILDTSMYLTQPPSVEMEASAIKLGLDENIFTPAGEITALIASRYDRRIFHLFVKSFTRDMWTAISVGVRQKQSGSTIDTHQAVSDDEPVLGPDLIIPVQIRYRRWAVWRTRLLDLVGGAAVLVGTALVATFAALPEPSKWLILGAIVALVIGLVMQFIVRWFRD